ncbi:MAG: hypothetical protein RJA69_688, partial [Pseudomonadota bacterium]
MRNNTLALLRSTASRGRRAATLFMTAVTAVC